MKIKRVPFKLAGPSITMAITLACSALPSIANAQLEEIVVTAQKRAQSLQEVPIAISAFSEQLLEDIKAVDVQEIALRTPNFTTTQFGLGEPQYFIRGVGSTSDSASGDPTVPVFIDEIYIARPAASNFDFFDLERIEVLRGPQGTLFGRNTTGGAVSVVTKKPSLEESSAKLQSVFGTDGLFEARASGNLAVSDQVAIKGAVSHRSLDGFHTNIDTGEEIDEIDNISGRVQVLYEPSDKVSWLFGLDFAEDDNGGSARSPVIEPGTPLTAAFTAFVPEGATIRNGNFDPIVFQEREVFGALARGEFETSIGQVTSITGYREAELSTLENIRFVPVITENFDFIIEDSDQFSQELRLASNPDSRVQWVAGLFYFEENVERFESFAFTIPDSPLSGDVSFLQDANTTSAAIFGQATFPVSDNFNITAGLRYTDDNKEIVQTALNNDPTDETPGVPLFPGQPFQEGTEASFDAVTGKLSFEYTTGGGSLLYASYSRGFKSGVFPSQGNSIEVVTTPQPEEIADSFEIGIRNDLWDNRLRFNATAFYVEYADLQQFILQNLVLVTFSVDAEIFGLELEGTLLPTDWLELGFSASAIDTEITSSTIAMPDLTGNVLRAPDTSFNVYAAATFEGLGGKFRIRGNYASTDDFFSDVTNAPEILIDGYGLLDARISYTPSRAENLNISLWGKNLTDEDYRNHVIPFGGSSVSLFGPPRTYGLSVTYDF